MFRRFYHFSIHFCIGRSLLAWSVFLPEAGVELGKSSRYVPLKGMQLASDEVN